MYTAGYIDLEIYRCLAENITTSEVVLTEERLEHIEARHPNAFKRIQPFLQTALESPDYILKDQKPFTGLILKSVVKESMHIQIVLRVHTSEDFPNYKNSILSAWEISESRWNNYLRHKHILYKRE